MSNKNKLFVNAFFVAVLLVAIFFIVKEFSSANGLPVDSDAQMKSFVDCLSKKDMSLLGVSDEVNLKMQLDMFGNYSSKINFVDCSLNQTRCEGMIGSLMWEINGVRVYGGLSLGALERFSGCSLG